MPHQHFQRFDCIKFIILIVKDATPSFLKDARYKSILWRALQIERKNARERATLRNNGQFAYQV